MMNLKRVLLNNIGLKLLALILAFVTWFYIGEATKLDEQKTVLQKIFSPSYNIAKKLYVKPIFVGSISHGYKFAEDEISVTPEFIIVLGSPDVLEEKEYIYTEAIDLSEHTKAKIVSVALQNISPSIQLQETNVQVYLPIKKVGKDTE